MSRLVHVKNRSADPHALACADGRPLDPNDPAAMVARPPNAWEAMLRGLHGVVSFFSRISFLVDENTHAVHFFISALLQLLDRCAAATRLPWPAALPVR